jgi:hypothetical protein
LSAAAYQAQRRTTGAVAAGLALMMRELAAPYALLCAWHAWRSGGRNERRLWLAIALTVIVYYGVHVARAVAAQQPGDLRSASWVAFGGISLLVRMTGVGTVTGGWPWNTVTSGLWLGLAVASTFAPAMRFEMRAAVLLYVIAFAAIGQPHDMYWGLIFVPVQALAIGFVPQAARTLWRYRRMATSLGRSSAGV